MILIALFDSRTIIPISDLLLASCAKTRPEPGAFQKWATSPLQFCVRAFGSNPEGRRFNSHLHEFHRDLIDFDVATFTTQATVPCTWLLSHIDHSASLRDLRVLCRVLLFLLSLCSIPFPSLTASLPIVGFYGDFPFLTFPTLLWLHQCCSSVYSVLLPSRGHRKMIKNGRNAPFTVSNYIRAFCFRTQNKPAFKPMKGLIFY